MKAIVYKQYGGPDVLHVEDVEKPKPAVDQVLVSVRAVEATKADCEIAATVDKIYPMAEAAQAHRRVETEQRLGTVVISVGGCGGLQSGEVDRKREFVIV